MSIYLVTFKVEYVSGADGEGSFISECEIDNIESAEKNHSMWVDRVKSSVPTEGAPYNFMITGIFKL